ncbi:MAG TPA: hypothetical protein VK059_08365 [Nocardioidaceae bacterium]|nr:hypothetical protein [Nocardioidaceae bacterium]
MPKFVRVRDEATGHEYSTARVLKGHKVLDKPAVDRNGELLPAKPRVDLGAVKSAKPDASTASHAEVDLGKSARAYARKATAEKE